ncbi:G-protein coupled receptor family C group 6 member A [Hemiscyllium ocellatum]|uniref:G-protein coupled receptor family C group 6 member A n=1 Tax=Hemiscyllium ocellatum TaxID=170820 RepID=UPI0029675F58|nr:G-protein coupled receptor family C group 6 member A [Hemiscyllium ocellatum]
MFQSMILYMVPIFCVLSITTVLACDILDDFDNTRDPGDIIIGGLIPVHEKVVIAKKPESQKCTGYDVRGLMKALALIHSIEMVNNSTLLPGIKLGYEIYDTCTDPTKALKATLRFLSNSNSTDNCVKVQCNYTDYRPTVQAVVGAATSEVSIAIARLLNIQLIPQISYSSSAKILSDKARFPAFFRTIPSDEYQTKGMVKLVQMFQWNWIGTIASDEEYSRSGINNFITQAEQAGICIAFQEVIPFYSSVQVTNFRIKEIANIIINQTRVNVIVSFGKSSHVAQLFKELSNQNISKVWIASDSWSTNSNITRLENIQNLGNIVGFTFKSGDVSMFQNYVKNLPSNPKSSNTFLTEYYNLRKLCAHVQTYNLDSCLSNHTHHVMANSLLTVNNSMEIQYQEDDFLVNYIDPGVTSNIQWSVTALAHALKMLLKCNEGICQKSFNFAPWELLEYLKKVNMTDGGTKIHFDPSGDLMSGYDIVMWNFTEGKVEINRKVAEYDIEENKITVRDSKLNSLKAVVSKCSKQCQPGQIKLSSESQHTCCYDCINCTFNTYSKTKDALQCDFCLPDEWAPSGSAHCYKKRIIFLDWSNGFSIVLLTLAAFGIVLIIIIISIFFKNVSTPAVKSNGGTISFIMLISLLFSFLSVGFFIGKPNDITCNIRQCLFGISFTLSVSCALAKSLKILLAFDFNPANQHNLRNFYHSGLITSFCTGLQVIICTMWLVFNGPKMHKDDTRMQKEILIECNEGSYVAFAVMLGYIAFLALICFSFAFKGRKLPENYNEAKFITFSMLIYFISWITFVPVYVTTHGLYLPAVEVVAILSSTYGILCCQFFPKCYIILFKKECNTTNSFLKNLYDYSLKSTNLITNSQHSLNCSGHNKSCKSIKSNNSQKILSITSAAQNNGFTCVSRKRSSSW